MKGPIFAGATGACMIVGTMLHNSYIFSCGGLVMLVFLFLVRNELRVK